MIPFLRKKQENKAPPAAPKPEEPRAESKESKLTTPGVKMLKEVWHIDTEKKKKVMPPPGVPTDIYCIPKQRHMPRRQGGMVVD